MTLHLINKCDTVCWHLLLSALTRGDELILIEDAVLAALPQHPLAGSLAQAQSLCRLHAQTDDLAVRGISGKIRADVAQVSYRDVVAMSLAHARVVNWR